MNSEIFNATDFILSKEQQKYVMSASDTQPYFVVNTEGYNRMLSRLQNGEQFVKSYSSMCPHRKKEKCDCPFYTSYLLDGKMVRNVNGEIKPVYSREMLKQSNKMPEIIVGLTCNKCGYELPAHIMTQHFDVKFMEELHSERDCEKLLLNKMCRKK